MNGRGQAQVLWVILEFVLVIAVTIALFQLIERARESQLPKYSLAGLELKFTREALEVYAKTSIHYQLGIPGVGMGFPVGFASGSIVVGKNNDVSLAYGFDKTLEETAYGDQYPVSVPLELAGGVVHAGADATKQSNVLKHACDALPSLAKIAFLPAVPTPQTILLVTTLVGQNPSKYLPAPGDVSKIVADQEARKQLQASANAVVLVATVVGGNQVIAYANAQGRSLACALVNGLTPRINIQLGSAFESAIIPLPDDSSLVPHDKPAVYLLISDADVANNPTWYQTTAVKLHDALK
ncbi:hypothetical protein HY493_02185 [Candidatus Woesearchaeota archaeon]|nr:hypothetical protein [Candidatus Woesearchaeota archaeon]